MDTKPAIMIMGLGCLIYNDEGFGIKVLDRLKERYCFPEYVTLVDGSLLGTRLLGVVSQPDHLIAVDVMRRGGTPGDRYRLEDETLTTYLEGEIAHYQSEFHDALVMCQALDRVPQTVILGVEPQDIKNCGTELTTPVAACIDPVVDAVVVELERLGVEPSPGPTPPETCCSPFD